MTLGSAKLRLFTTILVLMLIVQCRVNRIFWGRQRCQVCPLCLESQQNATRRMFLPSPVINHSLAHLFWWHDAVRAAMVGTFSRTMTAIGD